MYWTLLLNKWTTTVDLKIRVTHGIKVSCDLIYCSLDDTFGKRSDLIRLPLRIRTIPILIPTDVPNGIS